MHKFITSNPNNTRTNLIRFFDIVFSALALLFFAPLLLLIAVLVKSGSKGNIFFKQTRVGKGGNDFALFKFRTMCADADRHGLLTVGGRDSRITTIGYFLRKYKLDELPQLWNVLKGDMSVVGPRPEVRKYVDLYTSQQREVLSVKPGLTDYASIEFRNESDMLAKVEDAERYYIETIMPRKIALNKYYIENQSLQEYFNIIFRTQLSIADFRKFLIRHHFSPKWGIFLTDILVSIVALTLANYLSPADGLFQQHLLPSIGLTAITCSVFFIILKPYDGIIQYSDMREAAKIFGSVFLSFAALLLINYLPVITDSGYFFNPSSLVIFFFVAFFIMLTYRLVIKMFFNISVQEKPLSNTLLCGAGEESVQYLRFYRDIVSNGTRIVGFVEEEQNITTQKIDGIIVYNLDALERVLEFEHIKNVQLASDNASLFFINTVRELCFRKRIPLQYIPSISRWPATSAAKSLFAPYSNERQSKTKISEKGVLEHDVIFFDSHAGSAVPPPLAKRV